MNNRVYIVLIDSINKRVGLNMKDCTLPAKHLHHEGMYGLFGGQIENDETPWEAAIRELSEEINQDIFSYSSINIKYFNTIGHFTYYSLEVDLSGDKTNRSTSCIGKLASACMEGDGLVRTFDFIYSCSELLWYNREQLSATKSIVNSAACRWWTP